MCRTWRESEKPKQAKVEDWSKPALGPVQTFPVGPQSTRYKAGDTEGIRSRMGSADRTLRSPARPILATVLSPLPGIRVSAAGVSKRASGSQSRLFLGKHICLARQVGRVPVP